MVASRDMPTADEGPAEARRSRAWAFGLLGCWLLACGCDRWSLSASDRSHPYAVKSAQFGVFYGGQIQQRNEIPFELEAGQQQFGFRVLFEEPLAQAAELRWELSKPTRRRRRDPAVSRPEGRVTQLESVPLTAGETRFEHSFEFQPGDPLGLWNIRVTLGPRVLIDRPFMVYDPVSRKRAKAAAHVPDAGLFR